MPTLRQLIRVSRKPKGRGRTRLWNSKPQEKGVCVRVYTTSPRKPNSAVRKVARVRLSGGRLVTAYIPGEGHALSRHSVVLARPGRVRDLPGVRYKLIRGKYDLSGILGRSSARSKYGTKRISQ